MQAPPPRKSWPRNRGLRTQLTARKDVGTAALCLYQLRFRSREYCSGSDSCCIFTMIWHFLISLILSCRLAAMIETVQQSDLPSRKFLDPHRATQHETGASGAQSKSRFRISRPRFCSDENLHSGQPKGSMVASLRRSVAPYPQGWHKATRRRAKTLLPTAATKCSQFYDNHSKHRDGMVVGCHLQ